MGNFGSHVAPAYGIEKAGFNWITMYVHFLDLKIPMEKPKASPISLRTSSRIVGLPEAPNTKQQSSDGILKLIDNATRAETSGKFFDVISGVEILTKFA
ncbi:hypothetical protein F5Y03DRAFT_395778 [Xylaria venustula]|nr:hypothetical protein F5Y03DRAFT_395778 [Xylaria venustula]